MAQVPLPSQMPSVKKGSMKYWKAVVRSIMAWMWVWKRQKRAKIEEREAKIRDLEQGLALYKDMARDWCINAIKSPIGATISDPSLNLNIMDTLVTS